MPETHELVTLVQSRTPIIVVESIEEQRVLDLLKRSAAQLGRGLFRWTITQGLCRVGERSSRQDAVQEPGEVLQHIWAMQISGIYLLVDFHPFLDDPKHIRQIKEVALQAESRRQTIVFMSHAIKIPEELRHFVAHFELKLPSESALMQTVAKVAGQWAEERKDQKLHIDREALRLLVQNLRGLTLTEAERLARTAIYDDGAITLDDLTDVARAKHDLLNGEGILSFEHNTARFSEVGGLGRFKQWLAHRRVAFFGDPKATALDPPKGILLLGVQGGGKSLAAKAVAGTWGIPLLRLDFGALYNKYHGETERRTREALRMAEVMAPCVLWLDEIEKGISTGDSDAGTSKRLLGTLLTWMAERSAPVFIVATANDIQSLPPELMRKGRLDEIFFVDLPDPETRGEIFAIHMAKRGLVVESFDLPALATASDGFSGAEIEQAIVAGLYSAQGGSGRLDQQILVDELHTTRPLSVVMSEHIGAMRAWANERTVPAH
ncbi:MAG: AAA family ATPase [Rhodothermales bacterium]